MNYFEPETFITKLVNQLDNTYKITKRHVEGEPIKYKISTSPQNFAYLYFSSTDVEADNEAEVSIELDFSSYATKDFISDLKRIVYSALEG